MSFQLEVREMLSYIDTVGVNGFDDSQIENLERIVQECNRQHGEGIDGVVDSLYDQLYQTLKEVAPESGILSELWEPEGDITEYNDLLLKNPMMSIETAKSFTCSEFLNWVDKVPSSAEYFLSYKINGHGIRIVYKDGSLVLATSRARASAGRDITRQMRVLLGGYNEALADMGLVELRGEVCLETSNLPKARAFNPALVSAFSAVASLIKPSASEEEISLLDFLCYSLISEGFSFQTKEEEYQFLEEAGYKVPSFITFVCDVDAGEDMVELIKDSVVYFEEQYEDFGYYCDGIVIEINDRNLFYAMGTEGNHNCGNLALKVGVWEQSLYVGFVNGILWTRGKGKRSPVAIVAPDMGMIEVAAGVHPGQLTSEKDILNYSEMGIVEKGGNTVRRVPLYEPKNLVVLDAYLGEALYFRYGGEAGVVPCFSDGRLLKEDAVKSMLSGEEVWIEL